MAGGLAPDFWLVVEDGEDGDAEEDFVFARLLLEEVSLAFLVEAVADDDAYWVEYASGCLR